MAKITIETELNTKNFENQIKSVEHKLNDLQSGYEQLSTEKGFNEQSQQAIEFRKEIEKTTNSLIKLREQQTKLSLASVKNLGYNLTPSLSKGFSLSYQTLSGKAMGDLGEKTEYVAGSVKDLKNAFDIVGKSGEQAGERSGRGFDKGIKSLKRFALGLFGIRSAFSIITRASNSYLAQNETTANKLNAIWVALGNALGPIIEIIADGVLKLIGYLNVFLNALGFKVDLTKNMNKSTKAIKGTSKAMKELNNQMASFDEAIIQQKETSSDIGGGGVDGTNGFTMPELNQGVVDFLKEMATILKENWDWIWKVGLALAGVFTLGKLSGVISGLGGLLGVLKPLAALGTIVVGVSILYDTITGRNLYNDLKMIREELEKGSKPQQEHTQQTKAQAKADKELIETKRDEVKAYKKGSDEANRWFDYLRQGAEFAANDTRNLAIKIDKMSGLAYWYEVGSGKVDEYNHQLSVNNDTIRTNIQEMADMYTQNQLTEEQEAKFNEILKAVNGKLVDGTVIYDDLDSRILNASKHIDEHTDLVNALGRDTENSTKKQKTSWSNMITELNKLKATPTVEFKPETKKVTDVFKALAESMGVDVSTFLPYKALKVLGLAKGGIVNAPGKGVSLSSVVVGEATGGQEGVVPLNNEQSMDLIGQSIARHVVINLTNNTMLDSKVIAREQRKIQDSTSFATNGRGVL